MTEPKSKPNLSGEDVDQRHAQGPLYKPSGPVTQTFINIGNIAISSADLKRIILGEFVGVVLMLLGLWISQYVVPITASFDGVIVRAAAFVIPLSLLCGLFIYFLSRRTKYQMIDATVAGVAALTGLILLILTWVLICRSPL